LVDLTRGSEFAVNGRGEGTAIVFLVTGKRRAGWVERHFVFVFFGFVDGCKRDVFSSCY
jgi:hypothetical protein